MDRYIVREPRVGADYPHGNQMLGFPSGSGNRNNMAPETKFFGGYGAEFPTHSPGFMGLTHVNAPFVTNHPNPGPNPAMSGIDPRYLAAYADENANFIAGQRQQMKRDQNTVPPNGPAFGSDYENRNFIAPDRRLKTFTSQMGPSSNAPMHLLPNNPNTTHLQREPPTPNTHISSGNVYSANQGQQQQNFGKSMAPVQKHQVTTKTPSTTTDNDAQKSHQDSPVMTRADKLRELHKTGTRVFSGPVEKVLKWHKSLQDLGVLVLYEIVAKCVSVRSSETCAKTLVVRDDNGPAMQVVYYEIDFLLPDLKPPCTVRVVGRMLAGTSRLQAFSVRAASGDDVNTLPRRAAVAAHHVSKLCKEYGHQP